MPSPQRKATTMQKDELTALAERVMALAGPCRENDARITYACCPSMSKLGSVEDYLQTDACKKVRAYTSSLDAAMTLVPTDGFWRMGNDGEGRDPADYFAEIIAGSLLQRFRAVAATPALALTAAALRARAAQVQP